ncbi:MAG: anthranilate phosphoribosyltransferase [Verrucomicrobiota bacterium]|nr:anthranilate phosphoribosyltransferase [Verrucomicrobiota bacterium]
MLEQLTRQLAAGGALADEQIALAVEGLTGETIPAALKADFLIALARKGETPGEIAGFARALRDKAVQPPLDPETRSRGILDVVGTGGDRLGTFNISTAAALVCAAAGVTVAKHGNRAVTSQAGSADVLEALGVRIDLTPADAVRSLRERRFAFFFAPSYHPAFKNISSARRLCAERGQRTIFNLLGPLLNPARPSAVLAGVPGPEWCEPLARVLQALGVRRAMVVCGSVAEHRELPNGIPHPAPAGACLDELSTLGPNTIAEFYQERGLAVSKVPLGSFPLQPAALADLLGGDKSANAAIVRRIFSGAERGPRRDAVLLNTAAALFVAGLIRSLAEGWDLAAAVIDSGQAQAKLEELAQ